MHHASHPRTPTAFVAMTDCWTGLAPLVHLDGHSTPPPQASRPGRPFAARLRRLLRLIA
ncbi:hypothetical protein [Pseudomonas linyingensis]|uniref:hypothetical protein n=1 Tax=Pseudomonas linyingensis TaxID=915471 RepID=UPI00147F2045|nr:hypothetical protein [Pseudomonas linyingensis]